METPELISLKKAWGYIPQKNFFKDFIFKIIGNPHPYGRLRAISVLSFLDLSKKKILDAGCGRGVFSRELKKRDFDITGIDVDQEAIDYCKKSMDKTNEHYSVFKENIMELQSIEDQTYDQIIATDVIEHVEDPKKAVESLYRVLKKGGKLILTVPTPKYLYDAIIPVDFSKHLEEIGHLSKGWFKEDGTTFLENCGFKIINSHYYGFFPVRFFTEILYFLAGVKGIKKTRSQMYDVKLFPMLVYFILIPVLFMEKFFSKEKKGAFIIFDLEK